jgi:hypothetical protein
MQKYVMVVLAALIGLTSMLYVGCSRGVAKGKLQVMYSGNIRGNVTPCG